MLCEVGSGCFYACDSVMAGLWLDVFLHGDVLICTWVIRGRGVYWIDLVGRIECSIIFLNRSYFLLIIMDVLVYLGYQHPSCYLFGIVMQLHV